MSNSSAVSPLIDFLLESPSFTSEKALAQAVRQVAELAMPGGTFAVTTGEGTILSADSPRGTEQITARPLADWEAGPYELGAGLKLFGLPTGNEAPSDYTEVARIARAGVEHWTLAAARRVRRSWGVATQAYTQALVDEIEEEEALELAVESALEAGDSDLTLLYLPGMGGTWTCEFAAGDPAPEIIGAQLQLSESAAGPVSWGSTVSSHDADDLFVGPVGLLGQYGPVIVVPLRSGEATHGALVLLRRSGGLPYNQENLPLVESFAAVVTLALELEQGRKARAAALMLEERDRIGRDLHDLGIQLLFATGMQLDKLQAEVEDGEIPKRKIAKEIRAAMRNLEDAVAQIRQVVSGLKETEQRLNFAELLQQESSRSRRILGFAPSLVLELDGKILNPESETWEQEVEDLAIRVDEEIAADAVATLRESVANVARHAGARSVKVSASVSGRGHVGELVLSIVDDGRGIDPSRTRSSGIANMRGRAIGRGGGFAVGLGPRGTGTSVVWRVPLG